MIIKRNIMLIGSMGSGKSHFGRNLAERKGWQFVDTDRVLEGRFGLPIAEIFKKNWRKSIPTCRNGCTEKGLLIP